VTTVLPALPHQFNPSDEPLISDLDLYLFGEGRHERLWEVLGAHPRPGGCRFAVWAPNAHEVRVIGDFTGWGPYDGIVLEPLGGSGIRAGFVPGVEPGARYKYRIHGADGRWTDRADPMATHTECPPRTASVVYESRRGWPPARPTTTPGPCPSTRCTSAPGAPACPTANSPTSWCPMWPISASRTWS
jgi:1,4-alpha-glucan branching enzyme